MPKSHPPKLHSIVTTRRPLGPEYILDEEVITISVCGKKFTSKTPNLDQSKFEKIVELLPKKHVKKYACNRCLERI
jgi:hypothetical protein